jgi:hypothetical protein
MGAVAVLAVAGALWSAPALRGLPASADRFVESWRAVSASEMKMSLADKITYSLILAEGPKVSRREASWRRAHRERI